MAGTIVSDTLQDGAGNSTAMDNAIYGSAKAWVNFTGSNGVIRASYNVSSVTRNGTANYTVNFTNAFVDTNYCVQVLSQGTASILWNTGMTFNTTSYTYLVQNGGSTGLDATYNCVVFFR